MADGFGDGIVPAAVLDIEVQTHDHTIWHLSDGPDRRHRQLERRRGCHRVPDGSEAVGRDGYRTQVRPRPVCQRRAAGQNAKGNAGQAKNTLR